MKEMVGGCCVCSDDRGWPENPLVYCDGQSCTVAVHQACYGIVTVPTGPWYCRKCESQERSAKVKCELCPSKYGALKKTDNSGWAHVVCALYIPEVRFGNVTTMEPIQLQLIPQERFSKVCYICKENGKPANAQIGACMQCNKSGCRQQFHVTCAQSLGLLCEEAGNYLDNVKYCGYCQHHYSKLKKGGNVKTIPPYKPVSSENHHTDSSSEKETDPETSPSLLGKRKSVTANNKTSTSSSSSSSKVPANTKTSGAYQKPINNSKVSEKSGKTNSSVKGAKSLSDDSVIASAESADKTDNKKEPETEKEVKESSSGKGKKRKANSRTPTPVIVSENSSSASAATVATDTATTVPPSTVQKKESSVTESVDKAKKAKTDLSTLPPPPPPLPPPQILLPPPITTAIVTTSAAHNTTSVPITAISTAVTPSTALQIEVTSISSTAPSAPILTHSLIQSTESQQPPLPPPVNSVVVSVPLVFSSLSPPTNINNNNSPIPIVPLVNIQEEKKSPLTAIILGATTSTDETMLTSEMSGGGLKITFEKQPQSNMQVDLDDMTTTEDIPVKRSRSQSTEKVEKNTRSRKKNSNGLLPTLPSKRSSRSQHNTPPPQSTSFVNMSQSSATIKDSPPSSPSSESLGAAPSIGRNKKGRKSAPASVSASVSMSSSSSKDTKDIKLFQNGVVNAPHMLGNQLNLNSNMAQKMSDQLNSEMEVHGMFNTTESSSSLIGPPLHHRVIASARSSSTGGSSTASGGSGLSSMLGGGGGAIPQTLDQLLERQWEQGSQFLMEQAQHFDIASLLSCLHQLRAENLRLEEHVSSLLQRRDHLLAVNARLAIPLTGPPATPQSGHPHTVNNIHPVVAATHAETPRPRHSGGYPGVVQHPSGPIENGISPDQNYSHSHRSPATNPPQPSPNIRQSSGGYSNSGLMRQNADTSGRSAPRPHSYSLYQGPSNAQQQMVIRRDGDQSHQTPSKPS